MIKTTRPGLRPLLLLTILSALLLASCVRIDDGDEVLYLKTDNSYLPVYVRGNKKADTYIIWTHGGPGSSGMYYGDIPEIATLHNNYRVVYWDQMGSGGSTGDPDKSDYTVQKFSNHQDGIVNIVKNRYNPKKIILLGHSWGGFLTSYYMIAGGDSSLATQRQNQIDGMILLNPVLDIGRALKEGIKYIREDYAPARIAANDNAEKWKFALQWYDMKVKDGLLYGKDVSKHYQFVEDAGGMLVQRDRNDELTKKLTPKMAFTSPFHFYDYYSNQNTIRTYMDIADKTLAEAGKPSLADIKLPTLFIAGENDKIAFKQMSEEWFDLLGSHTGTPAEREEFFKLYKNCAHAAFLDADVQFYEDVVRFIENR